MPQTIRLLLGDSSQRMLDLTDDVVAVVCDPPYGLEFMGKDWDAPWKHTISDYGYTDGGERRPGPSFTSSRNPICQNCGARQRTWEGGPPACSCGEFQTDEDTSGDRRKFQGWASEWLKLCFEKLPSGGIIKVFGGTRMFHRMAAAMEQVGFEGLHLEAWIQGQGFPKSLDISKAIDRCLGHPRDVQGQGPPVDRIALDYGGGTGKAKNGLKSDYTLDGQARTTEAQKWAGWGTALKPSWEPFIVGRKP